MKYHFLTSIILTSAITSCSQEAAKYPNVNRCHEIIKAFVQSEVSLYDATTLKAHIQKQHEMFQENQHNHLSEEMTYFTINIERTLDEHSQDPVAQLTINAVKEYERNRGWGWSLLYQWKTNSDNTRSLWMLAEVDPSELEVALAQKEEV